ncbi:Peptidase M28 [Penicillium atrosanguineum]|uniref:Zn(2)-C6 fungal-type domain-containing protein n=1 Tax=Penicillium atrosanguineum TaxID=1132637 RepID=A0A9W9PVD3_9EURO|nr:Peptidase M28 [Penicillium atrosanguineum]KAJ5122010.1 hypothetical protein N7526_008947 [Penicillium atrosanguineum]KAJ5309654.1 Peptidase M28 [Penicillium atrosanguineum]KAJ5315176.1 hypothetical protein N7476_005483 [Penicillium atrosanguineum]
MSEASSTSQGDPSIGQPTPQLNRSCESCRSLKVRCLPNPSTPNQCQRCAKGKKPCVFVAPQRRRPRKRTDSRVAQLEKEMRMMRSLLKGRIREESEPESPEGSEGSREETGEMDFQDHLGTISEAPASTADSARYMDYSPDLVNSSHPGMQGSGPLSAPPSFSGLHTNFSHDPIRPPVEDVIDRGIITLDDAEQLVAFFIHELASFFPLVVLPTSTTAAQMRQSKPVLFLSVLAAASLSIDAGLAGILNREMIRLYADRFFIEGEKSLELVQALLLMSIFYFPPGSPLKLQFYQYTHIASTMALEIGLATKRRVSKKSDRKNRHDPHDEHLAEQARALLGCYHLGSTVAMKTRRPNLLQFNDWMTECVSQLERSPHRTDQHLAVWFELQRITDEAMSSFGLDDTSASSPLTESRVQAVLRWFDKRMETWKKSTPIDMLTVPMILEYRSAVLAMYELGVGEGYRDPDAIKRRYFTLPTLDEDGNTIPAEPHLSAIRIDINVKWMSAAQELLDAMFACSTETMRRLPNLMYTRFGSAVTSLLKIHFSVRTGALGEVVTAEAVNVSYYLDMMANKLGEASGGGKYKIPARWYQVVAVRGRDWLDRLEKRYSGAGDSGPTMMSETPSTATEPIPSSQLSQERPVPMNAVNAPVDSFVQPGVPHMPAGMDGMRDGYVAMSGAGMWPMDGHGQPQFFQSMPGGYQPSHPQTTLPPQFAYDPQRMPPQGGQARAGMELDGWLPDGSIFGMPPLPEF